jgi:hypothetical protein
MKQTAIQQAIAMVRSRMESIDETLMGKHTIHHLQQVERELYELLDAEKEQIKDAYSAGVWEIGYYNRNPDAKEYYNKTYNDNK